MARPVVTDESELGAMGVRIVDATVHDALHHLFRPRERRDLGIDGEIELVDKSDDKRRGTGRLIAVQIKCGPSFFDEVDGDAYVYRGESKHLEYWSDFSLPVLIVICDPDTKEAYCTEFSHVAAERLDKGWKIRIPKRNRLKKASIELERIARRNHVDDVLDLAVQNWIHARHAKRVEFCGIFEMPRDYHWYHHLVTIGDEQVMVHWLYARYGRFEADEINDVVRYFPGNKAYGSRLILCLIGESVESFTLTAEAIQMLSGAEGLELVRLIYRKDWHSVGEYETDGNVTLEYRGGKPVYRETLAGDWIS
jgi:hypothetical protein